MSVYYRLFCRWKVRFCCTHTQTYNQTQLIYEWCVLVWWLTTFRLLPKVVVKKKIIKWKLVGLGCFSFVVAFEAIKSSSLCTIGIVFRFNFFVLYFRSVSEICSFFFLICFSISVSLFYWYRASVWWIFHRNVQSICWFVRIVVSKEGITRKMKSIFTNEADIIHQTASRLKQGRKKKLPNKNSERQSRKLTRHLPSDW